MPPWSLLLAIDLALRSEPHFHSHDPLRDMLTFGVLAAGYDTNLLHDMPKRRSNYAMISGRLAADYPHTNITERPEVIRFFGWMTGTRSTWKVIYSPGDILWLTDG